MANYNLTLRDVIHTTVSPCQSNGGVAVLHGNIAEQGSVVKQAAVDPSLQVMCGPARPFNSEELALEAIDSGQIQPGDIIIIRYEGAKGAGMPEMLKTTAKIVNIPSLATCALITDGRFSGATRGPAIGHVSPEALDGGAIALIEEGDLITIDIPSRSLNIVGIHGEKKDPAEITALLDARRAAYRVPELSKKSGVLGLFSAIASDVEHGASIFG